MNSYPCRKCGEQVTIDGGSRTWPPQSTDSRGPVCPEGPAPVQRKDCPHCGEHLIRAANHPESEWHIDRTRSPLS